MRYLIDGELVDAEAATVSVRDRGFRYGDAVFETMRAYGGSVFAWDAHADRLAESCRLLGIECPHDRETLRGWVRETLAANDFADAYVRLSITRGAGSGGLDPDPDAEPRVVVVVEELPRGGVDGDPVWDGPASVECVDVERVPDAAVPARAKTHNYLWGVLARRATDADEALVRAADGSVAEGATSNVFFVEEGTLHTPALDGPVLPGITRATVLELAAEAGLAVATGSYGPADVREADEVFLTNTTWEVRPVTRVDDREVTVGPVTGELRAAYDDLVERRHYEER